jgi:general secretion pathway protein A
MDYFKILNLKQEPFSNSPEPEFFFEGHQYKACMQKLELAIRLRRGLNVVLGEVGTGKTTLCRQLILKFGEPEEGGKEIETHLILDPSFSSAIEFLSLVAKMFGVVEPADSGSEWQLKENIKNYLFRKGVDEGKIVVLIIDEGQKLPEFCVEILREFLNYETNEYKLLQIVIFAQREFQQFLKEHANFADRVNEYCFLEPLGFSETRRMIRFRLERASELGAAPTLFTFFGLRAVYNATKGYPRKINTLCHQVMLALIIQNRSRAGWALVRACAGRVLLYKPAKVRWAAAGAVAAVLVLVLAYALVPEKTKTATGPSVAAKEQRAAQQTVRAQKPEGHTPGAQTGNSQPSKEDSKVQETARAAALTTKTVDSDPVKSAPARVEPPQRPEVSRQQATNMPDFLGRLKVKKGASMWLIFGDVYGAFDSRRFGSFVRANPHIKNADLVKVGEVINLPAIPVAERPLSPKFRYVQLEKKSSFDEAYQKLKTYQGDGPSLWFFPYWNKHEGMVFALLLRDRFESEKEALDTMRRLPSGFASAATILSKLDENTVFFSGQQGGR